MQETSKPLAQRLKEKAKAESTTEQVSELKADDLSYELALQEIREQITEDKNSLLADEKKESHLKEEVLQLERQLRQKRDLLEQTGKDFDTLAGRISVKEKLAVIYSKLVQIQKEENDDKGLIWTIHQLEDIEMLIQQNIYDIESIPDDLKQKLSQLLASVRDDIINSCVSLAQEFQQEKEIDDAISMFEKAKSNCEQFKPQDEATLYRIRGQLAYLLEKRGRGDDYLHAANEWDAIDNKSRQADVWAKIAYRHEASGDIQKALQAHYERLDPLEHMPPSNNNIREYGNCIRRIYRLGYQLGVNAPSEERDAYEAARKYYESNGRLDKLQELESYIEKRNFPEILDNVRRVINNVAPKKSSKAMEKSNPMNEEPTITKFDVFLSHSSVDKPWVSRLKEDLLRYEVSVWLDQDEIQPGDLFAEALEQALDNCRAVALIVSPEAVASGWVKEEYCRALSLSQDKQVRLRLIPVLLREAQLPGFLQNRSWVDFRDETVYNQKVWKLVWGITGQKPAQVL